MPNSFCMCVQCKEVNNKHKMTFAKFKVALKSIAELLGVDVVDVKKAIASSSGPLLKNVTLPVYQQVQDSPESSIIPAGGSYASAGGLSS